MKRLLIGLALTLSLGGAAYAATCCDGGPCCAEPMPCCDD
jgi:hypothetical protein